MNSNPKTSNIHKDDLRKKECLCCGRGNLGGGGGGNHCPHCPLSFRDKENKIKSKCCNSWVVAEHADEGTSFYKCVACRKACDIASPNKLSLSNKVCNFCLTMLATMRPDMDNYCSKCGNRYGDKPSKKTEWEKGVEFGIKKAHKTWMTRIKKMRTDYKFLLHQRDNEIREKIRGMKVSLEKTKVGKKTEKIKRGGFQWHINKGWNLALDDLLTYLSNRT